RSVSEAISASFQALRPITKGPNAIRTANANSAGTNKPSQERLRAASTCRAVPTLGRALMSHSRSFAEPALRCLVMILQRDHQAFQRSQRAKRDKHDQR